MIALPISGNMLATTGRHGCRYDRANRSSPRRHRLRRDRIRHLPGDPRARRQIREERSTLGERDCADEAAPGPGRDRALTPLLPKLGGRTPAAGASCEAVANRLLPASPCRYPARVYATTQFATGADMIRIRATDDGTYTVYRDDAILVTGLTRDQADDVARSLKTAVVT